MPHAERTIEIDVTPEVLFSLIVDYPSYTEFVPEVRKVEILEDHNHEKFVRFEVEIFKVPVYYTLRMVEEPYRKVSWGLIDSNWMKSVDGYWQLEAIGRGKVKATYHQEIKLKGLVPKAVSTKLVEISLPSLLKQFKERAENAK